MIETPSAYFTVKGSPERNAVASQLRLMRAVDRGRNLYKADRSASEYVSAFAGLRAFSEYVSLLGSSKLVVDIGAGTTRGISEFSESQYAQGLSLQATVLSYSDEVEANLGRENTHVTSAEMLRGIADNSVAGILALNSIAYSEDPRRTIERIDQVLVPGGVIKATFDVLEDNGQSLNTLLSEKYGYKTEALFVRKLELLGYDIYVDSGMVVAIKPGGTLEISAMRLFSVDASGGSLFVPKKQDISHEIIFQEYELISRILNNYKSRLLKNNLDFIS